MLTDKGRNLITKSQTVNNTGELKHSQILPRLRAFCEVCYCKVVLCWALGFKQYCWTIRRHSVISTGALQQSISVVQNWCPSLPYWLFAGYFNSLWPSICIYLQSSVFVGVVYSDLDIFTSMWPLVVTGSTVPSSIRKFFTNTILNGTQYLIRYTVSSA